MKEYEVKIYETVVHTTVVEAESEDEALDRAYSKISNKPATEYETDSEGFTGHHEVEEL